LHARALRGSGLSFDCCIHGCDLTGLDGNRSDAGSAADIQRLPGDEVGIR
jgi:hypothetical protein